MTAADDFDVTQVSGDWLTAEHQPDPDLAIKPQDPATLAVITNNGDLEVGPLKGDGLLSGVDPKSIFRAKGEAVLAIGNDGDGEVGRIARDQAVGDMLDSGHGFLVRKGKELPKTARAEVCEICGGPLPTPGNDADWLCQYGDETRPASLTCNCPWCLSYQDYLGGKYKPRGGRPRKQCGSAECKKIAARIRKQKERGTYVEPEPKPTPDEAYKYETIRLEAARAKGERLEAIRWGRMRVDPLGPFGNFVRKRFPDGPNRWSAPGSPSSPGR
jgi:hypothetical protein